MAAVQTMSIGTFIRREYDTDTAMRRVIAHLDRNKVVYRIIGTVLIIFASGMPDVSAFASTGIDAGGRKIYSKILSLGKWVIIIKGGWDTINHTIRGDFDTAKKSFFSYLLVYITLLGLPWALDQVDDVFKTM